jgi:glucokinase
VREDYLGVDVGGTKIASAILREGELAVQAIQATDSDLSEALIEEILSSVNEVQTDDTRAIGIGVPSVVEWETGRARTSVNVPLTDVPLRQVLGERTGLPVFVDNDANLAALAEAYEGDELVARNLVMFTVGTGVGGGLIIDGRPYRGSTGAAAELGHTLIGFGPEGAIPDAGEFPQVQSLEREAAGRALDRLAVAAAAEHPDSFLGERAASGDRITGVDAVEGARAGDAASIRAVELLGQRLGVGIANAINTFDPDVVAIGGGVSVAGDLLLEPARRIARQYVLPGVGEATEIRLSNHGPEAGVLGAALLAKLESTGAYGGERER